MASSSLEQRGLRLVHSSSGGTPGAAKRLQTREERQHQQDSVDTVRFLRALLARAEQGQVRGLVYAAVLSNEEFVYSAAGEAHRQPATAAALTSTLMHGTMKRIFREE